MLKKKGYRKETPPEGQELLITVDNNIEADILESRLKASDIPVYRIYRETGAYLTLIMGKSSFGVDIYVPSDKFEEASGILKAAHEVNDEDILADPSFRDEAVKAANEEFLKKLDRRNWWMTGIFLAVVALLLILALSGQP